VTDQTQVKRLMDLARGGKEQGWWQSYDLGGFSTYIGLETGAISTKYYQSTGIPGLLQTAGYARAMHEVIQPALDPDRIDQLVTVRLMRQQLLKRDPPLVVSAIFDEAALHRTVGGASTMRAQLENLIELSRLPHVTIQVISYEAGAHQAMDSTFRILEFGSQVPDIVYVEGLVGFIYLESPQEVRRYIEVFEGLTEVALSPKESIGLIAGLC
jgi:Domain of unknown function (DUF5753)